MDYKVQKIFEAIVNDYINNKIIGKTYVLDSNSPNPITCTVISLDILTETLVVKYLNGREIPFKISEFEYFTGKKLF